MIKNLKNINKERIKKSVKKGALVLAIGTSICTTTTCATDLFNNLRENVHIYESIQSLFTDETNKIDYFDIINMINELDTLSEEYKNQILNSGIIEGVLPYYDSLDLSVLTKKKLNKLSIKYYDTLESDNDFIHTRGYYDPKEPNIINVKIGSTNKTFGHEFIHLLQSHKSSLIYLEEPVAELMNHDFFGNEIGAYIDEVNTLKLLICTIGPEPILQCSFGGDSSKILEILENNLESEDYEKMVSYLSQSSLKICEQQEFPELIGKLYKNMYGKEIEEDLPGYDLIANKDDYSNVIDNRYYLNVNKIDSEEKISFEVLPSMYDFVTQNMNVVSVEDINYYRKEISQEEYNQIRYNDDKKYEVKTSYSNKIQNFLNSVSFNGSQKTEVCILVGDTQIILSYEEAIEKGYIKFYALASEDDINIEEGWMFDKKVKKVTITLPPITETLSNSIARTKKY